MIWLVTGSSRGLGLCMTEAALRSGHSVIATARQVDKLDSLVREFGDRIHPVTLDVTDNTQVLQAVAAGRDHFGRIDAVFNNAGYADIGAVEDVAIDAFRAQIDANFYGVVYVTKAVLPIMRQQRQGHIFQVSSVGGRVGSAGLGAYQSAKWAVGGFSTVLAQEVEPLGIKVTVLEPGGMKTDWAGSSMKIPPVSEPYQQTVGKFADLLRNYSGKEASHPKKVAEVVLKLAAGDKVPLRLLLGPDAVQYGGQAADVIAKSDQQWRDVSMSTT